MKRDPYSSYCSKQVHIVPKVLTKAKPVLVKAKDLPNRKPQRKPQTLQELFHENT